MKPDSRVPDMFGKPREKGVSEWQTFNAVRRDSGAYIISAFHMPRPTSAPSIVRYGLRLLILKKA
ncbi:hypothetical protein A2765_02195 [Candidatus Kaiserbacteria bacterium RIFCSPHIGHO2_01_FULL_56_24]|uniref:Uncharacterized protein n=1 Tax=Candidatus Kaiserbacteria bacterium RIFCSPHIGHO2_01_FULL_56_24 TaxID=1798487 RepID=A0A1F6DB20_9BACT|nr:MAG: hypothetical protein A2765_02195 [Candidatus Kaiserbacteria bacterium RIFCSPHIGHO2_01_FULL_56_24]